MLGIIDLYETAVLDPDELLCTFDLSALYPSLQMFDHPQSVWELLAPYVQQWFQSRGCNSKGRFIVRALTMVLQDALVYSNARDIEDTDGDRQYFYVHVAGMTTGLPLASTVAALYIAIGFDVHVMRGGLTRYRRYIADGLGTIRASKVDGFLAYLNSCHGSLRVKASDLVIDALVHCLDLHA